MSLFGATAQSAPSLFGGASSAPSLFGATAAQTAPATNLFGAAPAAASAPTLFGAASAPPAGGFAQQQSGSFGQAQFGQAQSASLFGQQQSAPPLFGQQQSAPPLFGQQQSTSSLFGQPQSAPSLFGQQQSSLFGQQQSTPSLFGQLQSTPSLFGQQPTAQGSNWQAQGQQQGQQQMQQPVEITSRTRINQLPQNFQTDLFAVERHLREQRMKSARLWSKRNAMDSSVRDLEDRSAGVSRRMIRLRANLESFHANAEMLKAAVRTERGSAESVVIAVDNLSRGGHALFSGGFQDNDALMRYGANGSGLGQAMDDMTHVPFEYFARIMDELESRAHEYKGEIDEIAEFLRAQGVRLSSTGAIGKKSRMNGQEGAKRFGGGGDALGATMDGTHPTATSAADTRGRTIEDIIRRQYEYFMVVASHVAGVHEALRALREQYLILLRRRDPDAPNPFEQADFREKADKERERILAEKRAADAVMGGGAVPSSEVLGGQAAPPQQQQQAAVAGLGFGAPSSSTAAAPGTTNLFGSASSTPSLSLGAPAQTAASSVFGGSTAPAGSVFGNTTSLFGGPAPTLSAPHKRAAGRRKR